MLPARTTSPVWRFTPRRFALESRPLRELPPPFLCAIGWFLLGFGCPCSLRRRGLLGGGRFCDLGLHRLFDGFLGGCDLSLGDLGFDGDGCRLGRDRLGLSFDRIGL